MSRIDVPDAAHLLAVLWPALSAALERDQGAQAGGAAPSSVAPGLPVNLDVLRALTSLHSEIRQAARWASDLLGEPIQQRGVLPCLRQVPRWHDRLTSTGAQAEADQLAVALGRWLHWTKLALGLRDPDRRLGQFCPLHDAPLVELVAPGDDAHLTYAGLDSNGWPIRPTVRWSCLRAVLCRECGERWSPAEYMTLKRQLFAADARRLTVLAEAAA